MCIGAFSQDALHMRYNAQKPAKISFLAACWRSSNEDGMAGEEANQTFEFEVRDKQEQIKNEENPSAEVDVILQRIKECHGESVAKAFEGEKPN